MKQLDVKDIDRSQFPFFQEVAEYIPMQFRECFEMELYAMEQGDVLEIGRDRLAVISEAGRVFSVIEEDTYTAEAGCFVLVINRELIDNNPCYGMGCAMVHLNAANWIREIKLKS